MSPETTCSSKRDFVSWEHWVQILQTWRKKKGRGINVIFEAGSCLSLIGNGERPSSLEEFSFFEEELSDTAVPRATVKEDKD